MNNGKPVYCAACRFHGYGGSQRSEGSDVRCMHPDERSDVSDFWAVKWDSSTFCRDKNRDNNCPDFEKYQLEKTPPPPPDRDTDPGYPIYAGTRKLRGKSVIQSALESLSEMNRKLRRR